MFKGANGEVALTAGGGLRKIPGLVETFESVALVCFFHQFIFSPLKFLILRGTTFLNENFLFN